MAARRLSGTRAGRQPHPVSVGHNGDGAIVHGNDRHRSPRAQLVGHGVLLEAPPDRLRSLELTHQGGAERVRVGPGTGQLLQARAPETGATHLQLLEGARQLPVAQRHIVEQAFDAAPAQPARPGGAGRARHGQLDHRAEQGGIGEGPAAARGLAVPRQRRQRILNVELGFHGLGGGAAMRRGLRARQREDTASIGSVAQPIEDAAAVQHPIRRVEVQIAMKRGGSG